MVVRLLKSAVIGCAVVYCVALVSLYVLQRDLMYFPTQNNPQPEQVGLSGVTVERLPTEDGEMLIVWHAPAVQGAPTVLFAHGNGGEIADRANRFRAYQAAGFGVIFVSWRGYGGSTGSPSEQGLLIDARTAYQWLVSNDVDPSQIVIVGESLGTGAAVRLAAEYPVGALILGAPYSATSDVAALQYPWLPVRALMKDQFRSIDHIAAVTAPTLVMHGTEDVVIPYDLGRKLFDEIEAPKTFETYEGQGHEMLFQPATYATEIAFIRTIFGD